MKYREEREDRTRERRAGLIRRRAASVHRAFTLIEALVSISIAAIAGSALLLGISSSIQSTDDAMHRTIAHGLAEQLMDEATGFPYNPADLTGAAGNRIAFDSVGAFNGYRSLPPTDPYGIPLGKDSGKDDRQRNVFFQCSPGFLSRWQQEIDVYYLNDPKLLSKISTDQRNNYGVVEVRIVDQSDPDNPVTLVQLKRVVAYVP